MNFFFNLRLFLWGKSGIKEKYVTVRNDIVSTILCLFSFNELILFTAPTRAAILGQIWAEYRKKLQLRNVEGVFEVI